MVLIIKRNKTQFEFEIIFLFSCHLESVAVKWGKVSQTEKNVFLVTQKKLTRKENAPIHQDKSLATPDRTFMTP